MPKEIPVVFHNGSKLCLSFYHKRTSKRDWREILFVYENMVKNIQFFFPMTKRPFKGLIEIEKKFQKPYLTNYNLLIVQDLRQAYYQILLIILLKEFIKLNGKMNAIVIKSEMCGIKYRKFYCFFEYPKVQDDLILCKCWCCNRNYDEVLKNRFVDTYNILRISTSLFCCCRKVFTYMNEWMIEKKLMKH